MDLVPLASLNEFFHEALHRALRNQGLETAEEVEAYLVNLLAAFTTTTLDHEPLGMKLASAAVAAPEERIRTLRDVGDTSLYLSGFFAESLSRKLVDVDYYISLGGSAYGQLARAYERKHAAVGGVYDELGHRFGDYVEVLAEVSQESSLGSPTGVVQLYERWLKTGSEWAERKLRRSGVVPRRTGDTDA
jgi:hypothetical protein